MAIVSSTPPLRDHVPSIRSLGGFFAVERKRATMCFFQYVLVPATAVEHSPHSQLSLCGECAECGECFPPLGTAGTSISANRGTRSVHGSYLHCGPPRALERRSP